ncbi:SDR family NAD(P)-dependent oxidoreductase [Streptomyces hainanensis]|uniref:3-oxoacyl-ACP reductase FabG n=1 Tax=Streptomyces hainanensis TaxID=402648 RepID=A0A4R4TA58_9ACTN|nr:3-oxoacyl-ACP reductase family protein [Streptomyces hainanensis]TDC74017.1 3-oxoacyl-ACP reductase FabG [Streptomyces hainanensis]
MSNTGNRFDGQVALVTGGSRGIGAAIALRLAADGADVALTYQNNGERAAEVVAGIKAAGRRGLAIRADCADTEALTGAVDQTAATFGRLDILVNNAAVFHFGKLDELELPAVDQTLEVNVRAPFVASRAAVRHMGQGGRIVTIGSNTGTRTPFPGLALYATSKAALAGMTRGLAHELGSRGITVNLVSPGPTNTEANPADGPNAEYFASFTAVGRFAEPAEVAGTVAYVVSPEAGHVTGTEIHVDGGFTA